MNKLLVYIFGVLVVMMLSVSLILAGAQLSMAAGHSGTIYEVVAAVIGGLTIFGCMGAAVGVLARDWSRPQQYQVPQQYQEYQERQYQETPYHDGTPTGTVQ
jgi:hypothetical protein